MPFLGCSSCLGLVTGYTVSRRINILTEKPKKKLGFYLSLACIGWETKKNFFDKNTTQNWLLQIDTKCTKSSRHKMSGVKLSYSKNWSWILLLMQTDKHTKGSDPMYSFCPPVSRGSTGASTAIIDSYPLPTVSSTNAIIGRWLAYFLVLLHTFSYNSQYL